MTADQNSEERLEHAAREKGREQGAAPGKGRCIRCEACVKACPGRALELDENGPSLKGPVRCWRCGICITACPIGAIHSFYPFDSDAVRG